MNWLTVVSLWLIPMILLMILLHAVIKKVPAYDVFVEGGKDGFQLAISLIPYLVGMMVAISVFRASGAMDVLVQALTPLFAFFGVPADIVPLAFIRPISGAGALGMMSDLIATHGPDSFIGRLASTMQGSTDTTLYVLTVYFGAAGIKYIGDALKVGLLADLVGMVAAIVIVTLIFGS
ncbi:spore maturation protein [Aliibacillus thermotolerans]|uniref:Spore maturation protein n=1 Tax=Aliibacillus thermotolerans TaxID=1834418 RepID=A0ABW0UAG2_9BACI|nr:spore maturation protein [Aliibacillus thermotolerans]MDA3128650.1 spore maturation protein [Aliibacillus thermotolerans]